MIRESTRCRGSELLKSQNSSAAPSVIAAYTCGTRAQPKPTTSAGATNLFTAAPEFPAPNMPIAKPCCARGNQRATYGVPTENDPPTRPTNKPSTRNCQYWVAYPISQIGTTHESISTKRTMRPPNLSVHIPSGTRISEPVSTGVAVRRPNCVEFRSSILRIGMPITPNIIHTMKHTVKASVLTISTDSACLLLPIASAPFGCAR